MENNKKSKKGKQITVLLLAALLTFQNVEIGVANIVTGSGLIEDAVEIAEESEIVQIEESDTELEKEIDDFNGIDKKELQEELQETAVDEMEIFLDESMEVQKEDSIVKADLSGKVISGNCGKNVTYILNNEGVLMISGSGDMVNYSGVKNPPWYDYRLDIKKVIIENGITNIGDMAFEGCRSLKNVWISEDVTDIGNFAFSECWSLTSVEIPSSVISIGDFVFDNCKSLKSVWIPSSVTKIGKGGFFGCSSLVNIEIPSSITKIEDSMFSGCSSLASVEIPSNATKIGDNAFSGCNSLVNVKIPSSVIQIGSSTFSDCSSLTSMEIPLNVTKIEDNTFFGCNSLISVKIPSSVIQIGNSAFSGCSSLISVEIPLSVTQIGNSAFSGCSSLASVEIPSSVTSIGAMAFSECNKLSLIKVLNPYCLINTMLLTSTIPVNTIIYGYTNSTAQSYAEKYNRTFVSLDTEPEIPDDDNLISEFKIDASKTGALNNTVTILGTLILSDNTEASSDTLQKEVANITWTSSDSSIAEVTDCVGDNSVDNRSTTLMIHVASKKVGTVTITGTASNGMTVSCEMTVTEAAGGYIVIDQKVNDFEGHTIALSGTLTLEESMEASKATLEAAIDSLKFESSDDSKAKVLACNAVQSQDHRSATLEIWTTLYNKGTATITVTAANGHTSKCEITIAEDNSENNTSYESDYASEMREFLLNKGTFNTLKYLCNDTNFTASTFVAEKDATVGSLLVMSLTDMYYRGWDGWKDLIDGSTSVEEAEKILASLLGQYEKKVEGLSEAKTAQKYAKMINNAFSDYSNASNLFKAMHSDEIEVVRKYFSESNIAKLLYEGKYDEIASPVNQILQDGWIHQILQNGTQSEVFQEGSEAAKSWNKMMEGFTQSAEMSKILKEGCQEKLGKWEIGGGLSDIGDALKLVSFAQDTLNYLYQLDSLLTADEMYYEMLLYVKENCVYSVVQEAASNLYSVINDGVAGIISDVLVKAINLGGEKILDVALDTACKSSLPFTIIKSGFDWGVTLSNTFFKTGSTQELKDSLRIQAFLANCLGRWVIKNEMEYLSAIDTDKEEEKGKELYYSLYMLWEARKNAEETLQSLLKTTGANFSANYSVSTKITSTLESFHENIFTEEKMENLLGISVSCPVDVEVYDESGTKLLTVKDGIECQGHEKGIYYYCIYNPLSDDYDKYIYYSEDANYNVKIIGNDIGLADCSVSRVTDKGDISEFYFENMEIDNGTVINLDRISQEGVNYKVTNLDGGEISNSMDSRKPDKISTRSISLSTDLLELEVGEKQLLKVSFAPANATNQKVAWNSGNDAVVSVNNDGVITAIKSGTAVITVSQGDLEQTCKITVKEQNTGYKIDYNLNGGNVSGNPTNYTIDTLPITLKNPTRNGYTFTGWTGSNGNTPQKTVIITKGSTGDKSYTANWSKIQSSEESDFDDDSSSGRSNYNLKPIDTVTSSTGKWVQDQIGWWYKNADGSYPANRWQLINEKWYFFNKAGYMVTGWILSNNKWYYLDTDGAMLEDSWIFYKNHWYFLKDSNGDMATGWILWKSQWYYLNPDGSMKTGWLLDQDIWYYLNENGDMAVDCTTPDGYQVDSNGAWKNE